MLCKASDSYVPPPNVRVGHIGSSADPVGVGVGVATRLAEINLKENSKSLLYFCDL